MHAEIILNVRRYRAIIGRMATTLKHRAKLKPAAKRHTASKRKGKTPASSERFDAAADAAERKKISKTLDAAAFIDFHKKNADTNKKYWESEG